MNDADRRLYSRDERGKLAQNIQLGHVPECPRCAVPLITQSIEPRADVAYVRRRTWWFCPDCRRGLVVDRDRR